MLTISEIIRQANQEGIEEAIDLTLLKAKKKLEDNGTSPRLSAFILAKLEVKLREKLKYNEEKE